MMKLAAAMLGLSACLIGAPLAHAQAGTPQRVFGCRLGAKMVSVTQVGRTLIYRFGAPGRTEMEIVASAARGNVRSYSGRYAGPEQQLRFLNGPYSYTVYSMEGNGRTGANAVSGLLVRRGDRRIADMTCRPFAEFDATFPFDALEQDGEDWSAM